jgi:ribosome-associated protein
LRRIKAISEKNTAVRRKTAAKSAGTKKPAAKKAAPKKAVAPKGAKAVTKGAKPSIKKTAVKSQAPKSKAPKSQAPAKAKIAVKPKTAAKKAGAKPVASGTPKGADQWSRNLLKLVEKSLDADKAEDIVTVDLAGKSAIADYMVIATGRNTRQLAAMAHHVAEKLAKAGAKPIGIEGISQGDWVLVDGNDIIIHLFRPDVRKLYSLEKMWGLDQPEPEKLQAVG